MRSASSWTVTGLHRAGRRARLYASARPDPDPAWLWHDHGNETDTPIIWLDGLDIPLVQMLDASFAEHREDRGAWPTNRPAGDASHRWGRNLKPARREATPRGNPLFIYPFAEWRESLEVLRRSEDPHPMTPT